MIDSNHAAVASLLQILKPLHLQPEQNAKRHLQAVSCEICGQRLEQQKACDKIERAQQHQQRGLAHADNLQQSGRQRSADHENSGDDVDGGDHARAPVLASPRLNGGEHRHHEQTARDRKPHHVKCDAKASAMCEKVPQANAGAGLRQGPGRQTQINQEDRHEKGRERRRQQEDATVGDDGRQQRANGDANRKQRRDGGFDLYAASDLVFHDDGYQRQRHGAGQPEPAHRKACDPGAPVLHQLAHHAIGGGDDIALYLEAGRADAGGWNEQARNPACQRDRHQLHNDADRSAIMARCIAAHDDAEQNGQKRRALDKRVACGQLVRFQMIGQDAVFDRAEQRRDHAKAKQSQIEQGQRAQHEASGCDHLHKDFRKFQPPCDPRLVMRIGDLAARRRQQDGGQHEHAHRQSHQRASVFLAKAKQDQHGQHGADEIIVERGEELAPEQRRKTTRFQQVQKHRGRS